MAVPWVRWFTTKGMNEIANEFKEENLMGKFQFGKVYRGIYRGKDVTVKRWEDNHDGLYKVLPGDNETRVKEERELHEYYRDNQSHPNLAKMIGYCDEDGCLSAVYEVNPLDTLHNLLPKDSLTWPQRIKVALGFASALEFMHAQNSPKPPYLPYLIRNVGTAHIMLDQDYNPMLFDFSMISGGIFTDRRNILNQYVDGCHGYADPKFAHPGAWSEKCDVYSYGVLLLELITKKFHTEEGDICHKLSVHEWAKNEYKSNGSNTKSSLVHHSLESEQLFYSSDGIKITKLAMRCVKSDPRKRPTMKQVVEYLLKLWVIQHQAVTLGMDWLLLDDNLQNNNASRFSRMMVKRSDFQLIRCLTKKSRVILSHKTLSPWIHKQLLKRSWAYFSQSIRCEWQLYKDLASHNLSKAGQSHSGIEAFSYEKLHEFTEGFCKENFIGKLEFGKVFRGNIGEREVTVKIWEFREPYTTVEGLNEGRLRDEITLLQHPSFVSHPNLVKLIGYCYEGEKLGVVYDLKSLDTLYNLVTKDDFTWLQRIKVGLWFARLLGFLHVRRPPRLPYLVRNISAANIMLDQDFNPKLFDFGMFTGGILPDRRKAKQYYLSGSYGYIDPLIGVWSEVFDVFSYGVVLLNLISKRKTTDKDREENCPFVFDWAENEYEEKMSMPGSSKSKFSLVHPSLQQERGFYSSDGFDLTRLALDCIGSWPSRRPSMKQVVNRLVNLRAVRRHVDELGIK